MESCGNTAIRSFLNEQRGCAANIQKWLDSHRLMTTSHSKIPGLLEANCILSRISKFRWREMSAWLLRGEVIGEGWGCGSTGSWEIRPSVCNNSSLPYMGRTYLSIFGIRRSGFDSDWENVPRVDIAPWIWSRYVQRHNYPIQVEFRIQAISLCTTLTSGFVTNTPKMNWRSTSHFRQLLRSYRGSMCRWAETGIWDGTQMSRLSWQLVGNCRVW